jgi:hypothetical protein
VIYCVHNQDPGTPLDAQRPGLQRYQLASVWVDVTDAADQAAAQAQYTAYLTAQEKERKTQLIATMEAKELLPHGVRVFMLMSMENEAMQLYSLTRPQAVAGLLAGNPGYRRVKEFHDQIASLEAGL